MEEESCAIHGGQEAEKEEWSHGEEYTLLGYVPSDLLLSKQAPPPNTSELETHQWINSLVNLVFLWSNHLTKVPPLNS